MTSALVLGASGQLGHAVARQLASNGWRVSAATRDGRPLPGSLAALGVTPLDATSRSVAALLAETGPVDGLFHPLLFTAGDAAEVLAARGGYGTLVAVSSASVYADRAGRSLETDDFPDFPSALAEEQPTVAPGPATYSSRKAAMEGVLLGGSVPVSILRPGAIHGPYARHPREWWLIRRVLDDRRLIPVAYLAQSRFQTSSTLGLATLAAICLTLSGQRVLNVADPGAPDITDIAAALARCLDRPVPLYPFAGPPAGPPDHPVGATPWSTAGPFVLDCSRARMLGWDGGPTYADALPDYVRWITGIARAGTWATAFPVFGHYGHDPFDYAAEDTFLSGRALL